MHPATHEMDSERQPAFDPTRRFVKVTGRRSDGLIEFDFSIGDADLTVELLLPEAAFAEFCQANRVERLDA